MKALGQKYGDKVSDLKNKKSYATYKNHIKNLKVPKDERRKRSEEKIVSKTNSSYSAIHGKSSQNVAAGPYIYTDDTKEDQSLSQANVL